MIVSFICASFTRNDTSDIPDESVQSKKLSITNESTSV